MKSIRNRLSFVATGLIATVVGGAAMGQVGTVVAWGNNDEGQCFIPEAARSGVIAVAGGANHTVALKNGQVLAWGAGTVFTTGVNQCHWGQCIVPSDALSGVSAIACGDYHTMALKLGTVLAWGRNTDGQCNVPAEAQSGVTAIAGGWSHSIALKNRAVIAWGSNLYGECDVPLEAKDGINGIAGGMNFTLALKDGAVFAWGRNNYDQCTVPVSANSGVSLIASGSYNSISLKDGVVTSWGQSGHGVNDIPDAVKSGVTAIAGGGNHILVVKDGAVFAWGYNNYLQCTVPEAATSGVFAISGGYWHSVALKGPPATITGVLPISGPSSGNTNITITGTNFVSPATVTIGGAPATNVVVVSDTQITATTPAGFPGPAVVAVNLGSSTAFYYRPSCGSDVDNNGVVDSGDLSIVLLDFGSCSDSLTTPQEQEPLIFQSVEPAKALKK